jgi:hypothetical protein
MRIKTLEKLKFKLSGRSVPVVKAADIKEDGQILTLQILGECKDRPNSIIETWNEKGWEKNKQSSPITFIQENGLKAMAYLVSEKGETINIYTEPTARPNKEDVIGHAATMDDIADSMDLGKSLKNMAIGLMIGIGLGWFIFAPMFTKMMS